MRILIASDTHGRDRNLEKAIKESGKLDLLIHAGDVHQSEDYIRAIAGCPVQIVRGNNDYFVRIPDELEFAIGGYQVFLTHGHTYCVNAGYETIRREARARGANMVIFGHTHRPFIEEKKGLIVLNPGSLSYPRQEGGEATYILMKLNEKGQAEFKLRTVSW